MRLDQVDHRENAEVCGLRMGLVGRGIGLSRTPAMHEAEAAAQGYHCTYELLDKDAGINAELPEILVRCEQSGFSGLNVTFPFKQAVIPYLHQLSDAARRIGAVNTIVFRDGKRFGHNTDFWGFSQSLQRGLPDVSLDTVLLIGAGGAGAAVAHALIDLEVGDLLIADTRDGAAKTLALASGPRARAIDDLFAAAAAADGIINATPAGMASSPGMPIEPSLIEARHWVADIVYFPLETELLKLARERGCRTLGGEGMAVFQAVRAFELFTGRPADANRMRATFRSFGGGEGA